MKRYWVSCLINLNVENDYCPEFKNKLDFFIFFMIHKENSQAKMMKCQTNQIFSIFALPTMGLSILSFFRPSVIKSTVQSWSYGSLCSLQKSASQCLHLYPRSPIFFLQVKHFPTIFY